MKIAIATDIAASPEIVFATITDIAHWPDFVRGISQVEILTPGAIAVGTRFRETRLMFGRSASEEMTVAKFEGSRRFNLSAENHGTRYLVGREISPVANGSRLQLSFEGTPITLAAKIGTVIALLFKGALTKQLRADLADVKSEAERRARA